MRQVCYWAVVLGVSTLVACSRDGATDPATPATVNSELAPGDHYATINGLRLHYSVGGKGPVCIMPTPGWGPSSDGYAEALKPLEAYFTLVHLDTRGTGRSQRPLVSSAYNLNDFLYDLDAFRQYLKQDKVWLMGHSAGGYQALSYSLVWPANVQGLITLDAFAGRDSLYAADVNQQIQKRRNEPWFDDALRDMALLNGPIPDSATTLKALTGPYFNLYLHDVRNRDKALGIVVKTPLSYHAWRGSRQAGFQNGYLFADPRFPNDPNLGRITAPTLVVTGDDDFICPVESQAKRIHAGIRGSELLIISQAGHGPFIEQPDAFFGGVTAWLSKQGLKPQ